LLAIVCDDVAEDRWTWRRATETQEGLILSIQLLEFYMVYADFGSIYDLRPDWRLQYVDKNLMMIPTDGPKSYGDALFRLLRGQGGDIILRLQMARTKHIKGGHIQYICPFRFLTQTTELNDLEVSPQPHAIVRSLWDYTTSGLQKMLLERGLSPLTISREFRIISARVRAEGSDTPQSLSVEPTEIGGADAAGPHTETPVADPGKNPFSQAVHHVILWAQEPTHIKTLRQSLTEMAKLSRERRDAEEKYARIASTIRRYRTYDAGRPFDGWVWDLQRNFWRPDTPDKWPPDPMQWFCFSHEYGLWLSMNHQRIPTPSERQKRICDDVFIASIADYGATKAADPRINDRIWMDGGFEHVQSEIFDLPNSRTGPNVSGEYVMQVLERVKRAHTVPTPGPGDRDSSIHIDLSQWVRSKARRLMQRLLEDDLGEGVTVRPSVHGTVPELRRLLRETYRLPQIADAIKRIEGRKSTYRLTIDRKKITWTPPKT
ncbi:MAG TPA: hypothetical protein PKM43_22125, partial [Verrucomicrobiota bacterium]|nr:hypothetical protein [Verrucomicrobiota bacterium]